MINIDSLVTITQKLDAILVSRRNYDGFWAGCLSSSPLATAVSVLAMTLADRQKFSILIDNGLAWLCANANPDGGWGDTTRSQSNISTTLLCCCAFTSSDTTGRYAGATRSARSWLAGYCGSCDPSAIASAIDHRYGNDKTFSVPILTAAALAGLLGDQKGAWRFVKPLPFELSLLPRRFFKLLNLGVVSYALPALIAMGYANFRHRPPGNPITAILRKFAAAPALRLLQQIQPSSGGYLEAVPLTAFVVASLASSGKRRHPVVTAGIEFLRHCARPDGSWPIDTDLSVWLTTLSIRALSCSNNYPSPIAPESAQPLSFAQKSHLRTWLPARQFTRTHPFTAACAGGWGWSDKPGSVPDTDDTASALIALRLLPPADDTILTAARSGLAWLIDMQNNDGGMPTFCKGWGRFEFDRSAPDLTAHAVNAWHCWLDIADNTLKQKIRSAIRKALGYLASAQQPDGSWIPLWFGNENHPRRQNPTYGTARVILGLLPAINDFPQTVALIAKALQFLLENQNPDNGWSAARGCPSTIEETALAIDALASAALASHVPASTAAVQSSASSFQTNALIAPITRAVGYLIDATDSAQKFPSAPIGLYFAHLWYYEELYPLIFSLSALKKTCALFRALQNRY